MKKTLTALLLFASCTYSYGALTEEDYEWKDSNYTLIIKKDCSFSDVIDIWGRRHEDEDVSTEYRIQFGDEAKGIQLTIDESYMLPGVGEIDFVNDCSLIFNKLYTLTSNPDHMPMIYVGQSDPRVPVTESAKAKLAITFTDEAITEALSGKDVSQLVKHTLVENTVFGMNVWRTPPNSVSFTFGEASEGNAYQYSLDQSYLNKGLVDALDELEKNTAVLYFAGSEAPVGTGFQTGTFTVAFVGSKFEPVVPEPTTGSLSLLALAGLAARRRRK